MKNKTCCFTGHRELPVWGRKELAAKLEETIIGLIDRGIRFYGAGGAGAEPPQNLSTAAAPA